MRCFIAIDIPEDVKKEIIKLQGIIKGDVKLVEPENLHFTLKFLGEIDDATIAAVKSILAETASSVPAFDVNLKGLGVFPSKKFIRVVWIGAEGKSMLDMHTTVEESLEHMFRLDKPVPHLTIARVKSQKGLKNIAGFVESNEDREIGRMRVDRIKLKKSTLVREGPVYEDIGEFELC